MPLLPQAPVCDYLGLWWKRRRGFLSRPLEGRTTARRRVLRGPAANPLRPDRAGVARRSIGAPGRCVAGARFRPAVRAVCLPGTGPGAGARARVGGELG